MTPDAAVLRTLPDEELAETIARLQRTVACMSGARGETGLRIRLSYEHALARAIDEQDRRRI